MATIKSLTGLANLAAYDIGISKPGGFSIMELMPMVLNSTNIMNSYLNALVNRINVTIIDSKMYKNKLACFKTGAQPFGAISQHIFINPAEPTNYNMNATNVFDATIPDVKAVYFTQNSQKQFKVSTYRMLLKQATTEESFGRLVDDIVNQLYSGKEIYEFEQTKLTFSRSINATTPTAIITKVGDVTTSKDTLTNFVKVCRSTSLNMEFPGSKYNNWAAYAKAYNTANSTALNETPAKTWTPIANQMLVITADLLNDVSVDVLAAAFNMDKTTFMGQVISVDNFNETTKDKYLINAILCDKTYMFVDTQGEEMSGIENPTALMYNNYLTTFQTYGTIPYANAVAFVKDNPDYDSEGD